MRHLVVEDERASFTAQHRSKKQLHTKLSVCFSFVFLFWKCWLLIGIFDQKGLKSYGRWLIVLFSKGEISEGIFLYEEEESGRQVFRSLGLRDADGGFETGGCI